MTRILSVLLIYFTYAICTSSSSVIHYNLSRRGGPLQTQGTADLDYLQEQLALAEARFDLTQRRIKGNKVVRVPKDNGAGGAEPEKLLGRFGRDGTWYAQLEIGSPPQKIELDLDMLSSDFYVYTTNSKTGSRYDDFFSKSYRRSGQHPFHDCGVPSDKFKIPGLKKSLQLDFVHCRPPKASWEALGASGSVLGLAPSKTLSQTNTKGILTQLKEVGMIDSQLWSLLMIDASEGVLSLGGTAMEEVKLAEKQRQEVLDKLGKLERKASDGNNSEPEGSPMKKRDLETGDRDTMGDWRKEWRWEQVEGADGFWQILMRGVWINSRKVLRNQPAVIDISTPFILAPPEAVQIFYAGVSGSERLPPPYDSFFAFPCLNPPNTHFEFDGWNFPVLRGARDKAPGYSPGGYFSLGRVREGSGYCVGVVAETTMGFREVESTSAAGVQSSFLAGNGMRDLWVLGEPLFRGLGVAFNVEGKRVGFHTY